MRTSVSGIFRRNFSRDEIIDFFILPPSKIELKKRLIDRGRENKIEIKKRLSLAYQEISHYKEYKYILVNDNINQTVNNIIKIIQFEEILLNIKRRIKSLKIL